MRMNPSQLSVAITGCLSLICVLVAASNNSFSLLPGQPSTQELRSQSERDPPKSVSNPSDAIEVPTYSQPAPNTIPNESPIDPKTDPLFLEIQRMLMNQGKTADRPIQPALTDLDTKESTQYRFISQNRWHAIEWSLSAARSLEQDLAQELGSGETDKAIATADSIRALRYQAWLLLRPQSQPQQPQQPIRPR